MRKEDIEEHKRAMKYLTIGTPVFVVFVVLVKVFTN
jgi:hypothetical protein